MEDNFNTLNHFFEEFGEHISFTPIDQLDFYQDIPYLCYVKKGELDLYFFESDQDETLHSNEWKFDSSLWQGKLHFFRLIKTGELILSFPKNLPYSSFKIVGRPNQLSEICFIPFNKYLKIAQESPDCKNCLFLQLENWFNGFSILYQPFSPPSSVLELSFGEHRLEQEVSFILRDSTSPENKFHSFLIHLKEGEIAPLGLLPFKIKASDDVLYPSNRDLWFTCKAPVCLDVLSGIPQDDRYWKGWCLFYEHVIELYELKRLEATKKENDQFFHKKFITERHLQFAEEHLQTTLDKNEVVFAQEGINDLYATCQLVGNQLHLQFDSSFSANPELPIKEQVEDLCFNSHVYNRLITLFPYWWSTNMGPFLGFSASQKKPLALIPAGTTYTIIDLENANKEEVNLESSKKLSSQAFEFYRSFPLKERLTSRDLFEFAAYQKFGTFLGVLVLSLLAALLNLFFPFFNAVLFDIAVPNSDKSLLIQIVLGMLMISLGNEMFALSREYMIVKLESLLDREFESAIWQRILDLPLWFFRKFEIGDLLIRVFSVNVIRRAISNQGLRVVLNSFFSIIYLIPMFYYSIGLSVSGIAIVLVGVVFSAWAMVKNVRYNTQMLDLKGKMNNQILQLLSGISKIHIYGAEKLIFILWEKVFYLIKRLEWNMQKVNNLTEVVNFTISHLGILCIYVAALVLFQSEHALNNLTMGQFLAFLAAFGPFSLAVSGLSNAFLESVEIVPLWKNSQILFQTPIETNLEKTVPKKLNGNIQIDHISFRYDKNSPYIFDDISMNIQEGEFIGIVGHSGCGKSTLIRLLIGFEVPESGAIYYDNRDSATFDLRQLRKQIGIVLQTSTLIDGSIKDNIATGGFYTDDQIKHALKLAGFEEELKRLPMGINTLLMDKGGTFSGGQRQRLLIARALIGNPKILILDEATNALDNATQEIIARNLEKMNTTRIVIAHRLSRIKKADKIFVLNKGKIEDSGTFEELAKKRGIFADLLEMQKVT